MEKIHLPTQHYSISEYSGGTYIGTTDAINNHLMDAVIGGIREWEK